MSIAATERLLLAALEQPASAPSVRGSTQSPRPRSLSELTGAVGGQEQRLSRRIAIAAAIDDLRDRGLLEQRTGEAGKTIVELTAEGAEHVETVREELVATTIELVDDEHGRRQLTIGEAARVVDRSPVAIAAECSPDGVYHHDTTVDDADDLFVGRQEQLGECIDHLEVVQRERVGRAVLLSGPGGIGKTALAAEVLASARRRDLPIFRARCQGCDAGPYHPLQAALPAEDVPASLTAHADQGLSGGDLDPDAYEKGRTALFHDITEALTPAEGQPVQVVFLDDLHLADPATLAYLEYLLAALDEAPIVFLGAYRPTELPDDAPVGPEADTNGLPTTSIDLGQLARDPTRRLVETVVGRPGAPDALVEAVHERTGGNPLFLEATIEALLETDQLDPHFQWYPETPAAIDLPGEVQTILAEHIEAFDQRTREVLTWAAVAGECVSVAVLQAVCGFSADRLHTRLAVLAEAGVFEWTADRAAVTFRNEVVRETLLEGLEDAECSRRHEAVARALAARVDETSGAFIDSDQTNAPADEGASSHRAARIAGHYQRGGDPEQAIEWYRRGVTHAKTVYATEAAVEYAHSALELARDTDDVETLVGVATQLAGVYVTTGRYEQAHRYATFARERTPREATMRRQELARLAAKIAQARGEYDRALEVVKRGLGFDQAPSDRRCQLLSVKATVERERGAYERARETATELREQARRVGTETVECRAQHLLGQVAENQGRYERAREHLQQALAGFETVGDRHSIANIHQNLGIVAREQGEHDRAREQLQQALAEFEAVGDRHSIAKVHQNLGIVARKHGEYDRARGHYRQALEGFEAVQDRHGIANVHGNLGSVAQLQGEYDRAGEQLHQALEGFEAVGNRHHIAKVSLSLGNVAQHQGEYDRASEHYRQALEGLEAVEDRHGTAKVHHSLGTVTRKQGEYDRAREHLQQALSKFESVEDRHGIAKVHQNLGIVARKHGEYDRAHEQLQQAMGGFEAVEDRHGIAKAYFGLGIVARKHGEYDRAREHYRQALAGFETVQDTDWIAKIRAGLGQVAHECGDTASAEAAFEEVEGLLSDVTAGPARAEVQLELARLAIGLAEYNRAASIARQAHEMFQASQRTHLAAACQLILGRAMAATGDHARASTHCQQALEEFGAVSAPQDQLETLRLLVEYCRDTEDTEQAATYCQRARSVLEAAPEATASQHREWVQREATALESR